MGGVGICSSTFNLMDLCGFKRATVLERKEILTHTAPRKTWLCSDDDEFDERHHLLEREPEMIL